MLIGKFSFFFEGRFFEANFVSEANAVLEANAESSRFVEPKPA